MASFDQKLRTLYLMEILLERTDDTHMLNASELCTILDQEYGISTDRRTIYTEMEILEKFGLDIHTEELAEIVKTYFKYFNKTEQDFEPRSWRNILG